MSFDTVSNLGVKYILQNDPNPVSVYSLNKYSHPLSSLFHAEEPPKLYIANHVPSFLNDTDVETPFFQQNSDWSDMLEQIQNEQRLPKYLLLTNEVCENLNECLNELNHKYTFLAYPLEYFKDQRYHLPALHEDHLKNMMVFKLGMVYTPTTH